jgi:hypothetical protein
MKPGMKLPEQHIPEILRVLPLTGQVATGNGGGGQDGSQHQQAVPAQGNRGQTRK